MRKRHSPNCTRVLIKLTERQSPFPALTLPLRFLGAFGRRAAPLPRNLRLSGSFK